MKKKLLWFFINAGYAALLYFALVHGNAPCGRFAAVLPWLQLPIMLFSLFIFTPLLWSEDLRKKMAEALEKKESGKKKSGRLPRRSVPGWLSHLTGLGFIIALIWHGWIFTACVWIFSEILEAITFAVTAAAERKLAPLLVDDSSNAITAEVMAD